MKTKKFEKKLKTKDNENKNFEKKMKTKDNENKKSVFISTPTQSC